MIVIEDGRMYVGQTIDIIVKSNYSLNKSLYNSLNPKHLYIDH